MQINGKPVVYLKGSSIPADNITVGSRLYGTAYGHPNYEDGTYVLTSPVIGKEGNEVETENTIYILHVPA